MANALAPGNTFLKPETARATGLKSEPVVPGEVVQPIQTYAAPAPPPAVVVSNQPCTPGQGVPPRAQPGGTWTSDECCVVRKSIKSSAWRLSFTGQVIAGTAGLSRGSRARSSVAASVLRSVRAINGSSTTSHRAARFFRLGLRRGKWWRCADDVHRVDACHLAQ